MRILTVWGTAALLAIVVFPGAAQRTSARRPVLYPVRGVVHPDGGVADSYLVELRGERGPDLSREAPVDPTGSFEFGGVEGGQYLLLVKTRSGAVAHQRYVNVRANMGEVWVQFTARQAERPVEGVVSAKRLLHKPPARAAKEFGKALRASEKGKTEEAVRRLRKALEIDPEYMEAHNNLGSLYLRLEDYEKALVHARKACELDPGAAMAHLNLAAALMARQEFAAAAEAAGRAAMLDPASSQAHFVQALAWLAQGRQNEETVGKLRRVAGDFPRARLMLARVHAARGDRQAAAAELKRYLLQAAPGEKPELEQWLAKLEKF